MRERVAVGGLVALDVHDEFAAGVGGVVGLALGKDALGEVKKVEVRADGGLGRGEGRGPCPTHEGENIVGVEVVEGVDAEVDEGSLVGTGLDFALTDGGSVGGGGWDSARVAAHVPRAEDWVAVVHEPVE